jgi:hypothetical protein
MPIFDKLPYSLRSQGDEGGNKAKKEHEERNKK